MELNMHIGFQLLALLLVVSGAFSQPCPDFMSISLENGTVNDDGSVSYDDLTYPKSAQFYSNNGTLHGCPCNVKRCVRMCCPAGQFQDKRTCYTPENETLRDFVYPSLPEIVYEGDLLNDFYLIHSNLNANTCKTLSLFSVFAKNNYSRIQNLTITKDGSFVIRSLDDLHHSYDIEKYTQQEYCIARSKIRPETKFVLCELEKDIKNANMERIKRFCKIVGSCVSVLFMSMTIIVYSLFSSLRNLYGKTLMCQISCMIMAECFLPVINLQDIVQASYENQISCKAFGT